MLFCSWNSEYLLLTAIAIVTINTTLLTNILLHWIVFNWYFLQIETSSFYTTRLSLLIPTHVGYTSTVTRMFLDHKLIKILMFKNRIKNILSKKYFLFQRELFTSEFLYILFFIVFKNEWCPKFNFTNF